MTSEKPKMKRAPAILQRHRYLGKEIASAFQTLCCVSRKTHSPWTISAVSVILSPSEPTPLTMDERLDSSHFLEKEKPLNAINNSSLNSRLLTEYIDVAEDDDSFQAACIRQTTQLVGRCISPKQMLGILRVLKAITLCFLTLTAVAASG